MAGTASVAVNATSFTSLGTGPMYISTTSESCIIVAAASQPAAATVGHPIAPENPDAFFFSLAEVVWALSPSGPQNVIVTT
jgi:hypothetical protein